MATNPPPVGKRGAGWEGGRPKDESTLSTKPSQMRIRLRRAKKRADKTGDDSILQREIAMYNEVVGFKPVEEWTLEELAHGKPRNPRTGFSGRPPSWITADVAREAKKRLHSHAFGKLGAQVDLAVKTLINLLQSEETDDRGKPIVDARTKLAASQYVLDHVLGKAQQSIIVDAVTETAAMAFASAIVLDDGQPQDPIYEIGRGEDTVIDGEVVGRE